MKERCILMSGDNPKLILDGSKTHTRRIVKKQPITGDVHETFDAGIYSSQTDRSVTSYFSCPYGLPGDRLWVRETHYLWGRWIKNGKTKTGKQAWRFKRSGRAVIFDHNDTDEFSKGHEMRHNGWVKRPSIHMPRWASRITLEITKVRVERLQDISEEDAKAEGATKGIIAPDGSFLIREERGLATYGQGYEFLWDSIHGEGAWDKNQWVWVLEFAVVNPQSAIRDPQSL